MTGAGSFLRSVRPLWLREKLYYHLALRFMKEWPDTDKAELAFAPGIRMKLSGTDVGHRVILATGFYELNVSRHIARLAKRGGLLVDVGANYGYYSAIWAAARPTNKVIAYEADSSNIPHLTDTIETNGFAKQVTIVGKAVGEMKGHALFQAGPAGQTGQGGIVRSSDRAHTVEMVTLDDEVAGSPDVIDVLKIDVEGADTLVLRGADRLLKEHRIRNIFFEQFPARMTELDIPERAASELLRERGYVVRQLSPGEFYASPR